MGYFFLNRESLQVTSMKGEKEVLRRNSKTNSRLIRAVDAGPFFFLSQPRDFFGTAVFPQPQINGNQFREV